MRRSRLASGIGKRKEGLILFLVPGLRYYGFSPVRVRGPHCKSENAVPVGSPDANKFEDNIPKAVAPVPKETGK
jgi:hypothetical protein